MFDVARFIKERNEAYFSFDRARIEEFWRRYHMEIPDSESMVWETVCRAVLATAAAPEETKRQAVEILAQYRLGERWGTDMTYLEI